MASSGSEGEANERPQTRRRTKKSGSQVFDIPSTAENTPAKRKRGRPPGSGKKAETTPNGNHVNPETPSKGKGRVLFSAPSGSVGKGPASRLASVKDLSPSDDEGAEDLLVRQIREEKEADSDLSGDVPSDGEAVSASATPSKKGSRRRGKERSPTSPDLPPYEHYFWQNRPGRVKLSNKPLPVPLLTHEECHEHLASYKDPHSGAYESLRQVHIKSFPQWHFELSEDFNICLFGYGSKRRLVTDFAEFLYERLPRPPKIFVINGYTQNLNLRHALTTLATLIYDCKPTDLPGDLGSQPQDILNSMLNQMTENPPEDPVFVFVNSLDAVPLRRSPIPTLFAQLASHPSIHLLATCDTPNFPLLWDVALREQYCWVFHDTTTFQTFAGVEIPNVVDEVNELLGRSGRSIKGKGGAGFVLRSLPENARNLYRVLVAEILAGSSEGMDEIGEAIEGGDDTGNGGELRGVERKALYQKAVEEFICSNEMGFGQLLNEFYDHDMLVDRRDVDGTKTLGVPWRRDECEELLEELL